MLSWLLQQIKYMYTIMCFETNTILMQQEGLLYKVVHVSRSTCGLYIQCTNTYKVEIFNGSGKGWLLATLYCAALV